MAKRPTGGTFEELVAHICGAVAAQIPILTIEVEPPLTLFSVGLVTIGHRGSTRWVLVKYHRYAPVTVWEKVSRESLKETFVATFPLTGGIYPTGEIGDCVIDSLSDPPALLET